MGVERERGRAAQGSRTGGRVEVGLAGVRGLEAACRSRGPAAEVRSKARKGQRRVLRLKSKPNRRGAAWQKKGGRAGDWTTSRGRACAEQQHAAKGGPVVVGAEVRVRRAALLAGDSLFQPRDLDTLIKPLLCYVCMPARKSLVVMM